MSTAAGTERRYRSAAVLALAAAAGAGVVMCAAVRVHPWSMAVILAALPMAVIAGWHMVSRRGPARVAAGLAVLVAVMTPVLHVLAHRPGALLVTIALLGCSMTCARFALRPAGRRPARGRSRPGMPVVASAGPATLLINPRSGTGRVTPADLGDLAQAAGVDVVLVAAGQDLATLAEAAVTGGAHVLGVAGGDGSMAAVAGVASRHGIPFVCVPTGTRNHFALDLGLDPKDPAHAVTAFRAGSHVRVDLAQVNGRLFVNNAALGLYPALVGSRHYRRSKVRAVLDELPDMFGPEAAPLPLRFRAADETPRSGVHVLLVSNNTYRLGGMGRDAWRPQLDTGTLGVLSVRLNDGRAIVRMFVLELFGLGHLSAGYDRWSTTTFSATAAAPVSAAMDGEPCSLEPQLRFTSLPGALLVRLPVSRPRHSFDSLLQGPSLLIQTALGKLPATHTLGVAGADHNPAPAAR